MATTYTDYATVKKNTDVLYTDLGFATDTEFNSFIDDLILIAEQMIDDYCERTFKKILGAVEEYDGGGSRYLFLKHTPIISVTSIKTRGSKTDTWQTLDSNLYYIYRDYIYYSSRWPIGNQNIQLTYDYGYNSPPKTISGVCIRMVHNMLQFRMIQKIGPLVKIGDFVVQIPDHKVLTPELKETLRSYLKTPARVV